MRYIKNIYHRLTEKIARTKCRMSGVAIGASCKVRHSQFGRYVSLGDYCNVSNSTIGDYSYLGSRCNLPLVEIGPFCSIASGVTLAAGAHPKDWVSTSPMTYLAFDHHAHGALAPSCIWEGEYAFLDGAHRYVLEMGADCWVGTNAVLVASSKPLKIGTGAIVAAGAVVTKDVAPYSIVAGVPAREIDKRFDKLTAQRLLATKWWNLPSDEINKLMDNMNDVEGFLRKIED